jgi:CheY-like chemotaxis protein
MNILIIEDEANVVELIKRFWLEPFLKLLPLTMIITAQTWKEAVPLLKQNPEFVILDLNLPDMKGEATMDAAKAIRGDNPMLIFTGLTSQEIKDRAAMLKIPLLEKDKLSTQPSLLYQSMLEILFPKFENTPTGKKLQQVRDILNAARQ